MKQKQLKTAALSAAATVFILLAFVVGMKLAGPAANTPTAYDQAQTDSQTDAAPSPTASTGLPPTPTDTQQAIVDRLIVSEGHLQAALTSLNKASGNNKGGYDIKGRADLAQAIADITDAIDYARTHAEIAPLPAPEARLDIAAQVQVSRSHPNAAPNLARALDSLSAALEELHKTPGGNLGGFRDKVLADIERAASDTAMGITIASGGRAGPANNPNIGRGLPGGDIAPGVLVPGSTVVAKDALALQIQPHTQVFYEGMPLALDVQFRNTSAAAFRLPNNGGLYGDWLIRVESSGGKVLTGGIYQKNGAGTHDAHASRAIPPGDAIGMVAGFSTRTFDFVDGDLAFADFQKAAVALPVLTSPGRANVIDPNLEFLEGDYKVTLTARFPNVVTLDADTTPVWQYDAITSNTVEVHFARLKPEEAGSITGVVVGTDGKPVRDVAVSYQRPNPFNIPPVTDSGYAKSVANVPSPPAARPIRPTGTFTGGTPAGTTDANGAFSIKNLAPGTYIVTVGPSPTPSGDHYGGSLQPIEVQLGAETKLDQPVKATLLPPGRGAGGVGGA